MKWVYFIKELRDCPPKIFAIIKYLNHQYSDTPVERLRADGASVLEEERVEEFCIKTGIKQEFSHPHSQEESSVCQRHVEPKIHEAMSTPVPTRSVWTREPNANAAYTFGLVGFCHIPDTTRL